LLCTKFEGSVVTGCEDRKGNKMGWFGVANGHSMSLEMLPFSYLTGHI